MSTYFNVSERAAGMRLGTDFVVYFCVGGGGIRDMGMTKGGRPGGTHGDKVLEDAHLMSRGRFLTLIMENAFQLLSLGELQRCLVEPLAGWGGGIQDSWEVSICPACGVQRKGGQKKVESCFT